MTTKPVFSGEMQPIDGGYSINSGAWLKLWVHADDLPQFQSLDARSGAKTGTRLATVMVLMDEQNTNVMHSEVQLITWGQSMGSGAWIKLWIHEEDLGHFRTLAMRTKQQPGTRLGVVMAAIDDDETVVGEGQGLHTMAPHIPQPHIGALGMLAVRWCKSQQFRMWVEEQLGAEGVARKDSGLPTEKEAKEYLLRVCDIDSRKRLDAEGDARESFLLLIRAPFMAWCQRKGVQP